MGAPGSGKSLIGAAVAARVRVRFLDGDDVARSVAPARSIPAGDRVRVVRAMWLDAIAYALSQEPGLVVALAPLSRAERARLQGQIGGIWWVELVETAPVAPPRRRWWSRRAPEAVRRDENEPLGADEPGVRVANDAGLDDLVDRIVTVRERQSLR